MSRTSTDQYEPGKWQSDQSRVEFHASGQLSNDDAEARSDRREQMEEGAFSENMMDIIVEHQQPSKNVIKYHDRASDEI